MRYVMQVYELSDDVFRRYLDLFLEDAERRGIDIIGRYWVSVSERLPKDEQEVLICFDGEVYKTTYESHTSYLADFDNSVDCRGFRVGWNDFLFAEGRDFPTHWMPLPKLPEANIA